MSVFIIEGIKIKPPNLCLVFCIKSGHRAVLRKFYLVILHMYSSSPVHFHDEHFFKFKKVHISWGFFN